MSTVIFSSDLNRYTSKALIRAKVKELFTELSDEIFEFVEESGSMTNKEFETLSGLSSDFYNEYCSQLKSLFEISTMGKRSAKSLYITYNSNTYVLTQQGLTEKAPVTISKCTDEVPQKETLHDVEKACLKLRFHQ